MRTRKATLTCLLLETVGVAALFLPFVGGVSPSHVMAECIQSDSWARHDFWFYALPCLLAPLVCLQTLRSLSLLPLTKLERWLCVAFVGLLSLVPLGFLLFRIVHKRELTQVSDWILTGCLYGLALVAAGLLVKLKQKGVSAQFLAPLLLRCAYLPNAVFCLVLFSYPGGDWGELQVGAACVAATVVLYLVEIVHLTRQGLKSRPAVTPELRLTNEP